MTDEWEVDRLDLAAYLRRTGHDGALTPTGTTLSALHRAHVAAVPFENLDVVLGRGVSVDLDSVQAKLVTRRRGGYCYEHGVLFAAVLERLGYEVDRLLARIGADEQRPRPRSHMTLRVRGEDGQWLADVGFGSGLLEPLPWGATGASRQGGWTYDLLHSGPDVWHLREQQDDGWSVLYSFTEDRQHASDVAVANHFTSTHAQSPFVGALVVMRKDAGTRTRLLGRRLTVATPDGPAQDRELTDAEVLDALRDVFDLSLTPEEAATLTAALPAYGGTA